MAKSNTASAKKVTLADRLAGSKSFNCGPYKSAHVASSYASQVRRAIRDLGDAGAVWSVKVNAETATVRVSRAK